MSEFSIRTATRESVKPLIGLYSRSGCGKTHSALLLMRGLVGPKGRIAVVDTENGRASIFADVIPGGFSVIDLAPPFSAERYWDALEVAQENADGIIIDSFTHEWAGEAGVLDQHEAELERMAGSDWKKRESCSMTAWIRCKKAHKRLVERILRLKHPLIVAMRGEDKTHITKENGKTAITTDKFSSPIQDPRFIFEMLIHAECIAKENAQGHMVGGYLRLTKVSRSEIIPLLPGPDQQVGIQHGTALAAWCAGTPVAKSATTQVAEAFPHTESKTANAATLKRKLWDITANYHLGSKEKLNQFLIDEMFIQDDESLATLTEQRLADVIESINHKQEAK